MQTLSRHVHFGAGKFGLAFVPYFAMNLGLGTTLFVRHTIDEKRAQRNKILASRRSYQIHYFDTPGQELIAIQDCIEFDGNDGARAKALEILCDKNTVLVTTSIKASNLSAIVDVLVDGISRRHHDTPIFILCCENGRHCASDLSLAVETRLDAEAKQYGVTFINCVVDEICPKEPTVEDGKLCLEAESYREWVVGGAHCPTLSDILRDDRIKIVPPEDIDVYEQRKLWFVNGFQLAMAIHGVYRDLPLNAGLGECLTIDGEFARGIEHELIQAFVVFDSNKVLTAAQHSAYFEKLRERIKRSPDTIGRILENAIRSPDRMEKVETDFLGDLKRGSTLKNALERHLSNAVIDFIDKVEERLREPARLLMEETEMPATYLLLATFNAFAVMRSHGKKILSATTAQET